MNKTKGWLWRYGVVMDSDLECSAFYVGRHLVDGERRLMGGRDDSGEPPQQVGQICGHGARLVAVKLRQRLGLEVLKHEESIAPLQLHLTKTSKEKNCINKYFQHFNLWLCVYLV